MYALPHLYMYMYIPAFVTYRSHIGQRFELGKHKGKDGHVEVLLIIAVCLGDVTNTRHPTPTIVKHRCEKLLL